MHEPTNNIKFIIALKLLSSIINLFMKKLLFLSLFFLSISTIQAQIGISAGFVRMNVDDWASHTNNDEFLNTGIKIGVDYWLSLKNKRLDFVPELSYSRFKTDFSSPANSYSANFIGFNVNTNIYFLDFAGDCNCPTFSKDGNLIKKGVFIQVSPGISFIQQKQEISFFDAPGSPAMAEENSSTTAFNIGVGLGLDIGLTDFITITPLVKYSYFTKTDWEGLIGIENGVNQPTADISSSLNQLYFGIRLGLRFDELNKYR